MVISVNIYSQEIDTCLTQKEIINISNHIKTLEQKNLLSDSIIVEQEEQIRDLETIVKMDSVLLQSYNQQINFHLQNEKSYQKIINELEPEWYEDEKLWFGLGLVLGIFVGI